MTIPRAGARGLGWAFAAVVAGGVLVLAMPTEGAAGSSLAPLTVVNLKDQVCVSTRLGGGFSQTVTEAITSGIAATFSYEIELWRRRRLWTDESIVSKAIERVVTFNSLTNEFHVVQSDSTPALERTSKNFEEVKKWVTRVDVLPLVKITALDPAQQYYVRARATVKTEQMRSVLKFMLFFIFPFKAKTAWEQSEPFIVEDLVASGGSKPPSSPSVANP